MRKEKFYQKTLEYQSKITEKIFNSRAVYKKCSKNVILNLIEEKLNKKIKILSFGEKTNQKKLLKTQN